MHRSRFEEFDKRIDEIWVLGPRQTNKQTTQFIYIYTYIIDLVLSLEGRPFHPSIRLVIRSIIQVPHPWMKKTTTNDGRNNFIQMWSAELPREHVVDEELGPLRAMTATGTGLSLTLNTADLSFAVELKVFFFFSLAFYWSFFLFLSLIGFCFCIFFYETP